MDRRVGLAVVFVGLIVLVGVAAGAAGGSLSSSDSGTGTGATLASTEEPNTSVCVVLFYSESCPHCDEVETSLADAKQTHNVTVKKYSAAAQSDLFTDFLRTYDVPSEQWGAVPTVFVGGEYAVGADPSIDLIESKLEAGEDVACPSEAAIARGEAPDSTATGGVTDDATASTGGGNLAQCGGDEKEPSDADTCGGEGTSKTDLQTIAGLTGLAASDSVNPCALAILLVLLTTISTRSKGSGRTVLVAGLSFALAIFLTYFAMGVLLIQGLRSVVDVTAGSFENLYTVIGVIAIVLGLLNLKDWYAHGAGGFVIEVPFSWRPAMQRYLTRPLWERGSVAVGAFIGGVAVSAFLLPCTSGPYFVAGGILADLQWSQSLPLLAAYNLVFVLPIVGITAVIAGGFVSVERISNWREENIERLHLVAGLVLLALGAGMILGVF